MKIPTFLLVASILLAIGLVGLDAVTVPGKVTLTRDFQVVDKCSSNCDPSYCCQSNKGDGGQGNCVNGKASCMIGGKMTPTAVCDKSCNVSCCCKEMSGGMPAIGQCNNAKAECKMA